MMMEELIFRQRLAGHMTAIQVVLSMLIEQSPAKTLILDRMRFLADHKEKHPDAGREQECQASVEALRTIVQMAEIGPSDKPAWKPEVIRGGLEEPEKPE